MSSSEEKLAQRLGCCCLTCILIPVILMVLCYLGGLVLIIVTDFTITQPQLSYLRVIQSKEIDWYQVSAILAIVVLGINLLTYLSKFLTCCNPRCLAFIEMLLVWGLIGTVVALFAFEVRLMKTQTYKQCKEYEPKAKIYMNNRTNENETDYQNLLKDMKLDKNANETVINQTVENYNEKNCFNSKRYTMRAISMGIMSPFYLLIFIASLFALCMPCGICSRDEDFFTTIGNKI